MDIETQELPVNPLFSTNEGANVIESAPKCGICLVPTLEGDELYDYCGSKHAPLHKECFLQYVKSKISDAAGFCPVISCPQPHTDESGKSTNVPIPWDTWRDSMDDDTLSKYSTLASSSMFFLCGGCHNNKSLLLEPIESAAQEVRSNEIYSEVLEAYNEMLQSKITVNRFHETLRSSATFSNSTDTVALWTKFQPILQSIEDPGLRSRLQACHLNQYPRFFTRCCNREHCYRCKVRDFHTGKACANVATDNSVIPCSSCGLFLSKSDGCSSVTCYCGRSFSWDNEARSYDACNAFSNAFPIDTALVCGQSLCAIAHTDRVSHAVYWKERNQLQASEGAKRAWKLQYPHCPGQALQKSMSKIHSSILPIMRLHFRKDLDFAQSQNEKVKFSLMETFYPNGIDKVYQLHYLSSCRNKSSFETKIYDQLRQWESEHQSEAAFFKAQMNMRFVDQFLRTYGNHKIDTNDFNTSKSFNVDMSDPHLRFSDNNMVVTRPGNVSSFPAAFIELKNYRTIITAELIEAEGRNNCITFGVALKDTLSNHGSNGVGDSPNSWGYYEARDDTDNARFIASGEEVMQGGRNLIVGDTLTAEIDLHIGTCTISVNSTGFRYEFTIPKVNPAELVFAMTIANDHTFRLVQVQEVAEVEMESAPKRSRSDTRDYFKAKGTPKVLQFLKQIRSCIHNESYECVENRQYIDTLADIWMRKYGGFLSDCPEEFLFSISNSLDELLVNKPLSDNMLTWENLVTGVCHFFRCQEQSMATRQGDLAMIFFHTYQESAPFVAATAVSSESDEKPAALAYMKIFSGEMQEWYSYNESLRDPIIPGLRKCRCIPRHTGNCSPDEVFK